MTGDANFPPGDQWNAPPGGYLPPGPQYAAPPPPPPAPAPAPKKSSVGKRIGAALGAVVLVIAAKVGLNLVLHRHIDRPASSSGFDYPIGTCLNLAKAGIMVKPSDVRKNPARRHRHCPRSPRSTRVPRIVRTTTTELWKVVAAACVLKTI